VNIHIRELTGTDLNKGFLKTLTGLAPVGLTSAEALRVFQSRLRSGIRTYVALVGTRVVGTASLLVEQKFIHDGGRVGHIEDVAVHRDFQSQGIGSDLVRHATEEAAKAGCYKVILNCSEERVPFYVRRGYHRHDIGMRRDFAGQERAEAV